MNALGGVVAGMTWGWVGTRGEWATERAAISMRLMAEHSVNWTAIAFAAYQSTAQSTQIDFADEPTVSDDEIRWAIREAKALGLRVCLKPVVNCTDGTWRAHIGFFDVDVASEPTWTQWFASYTQFIVHAARIAQEEGAEMLCVGCEMVRADGQEGLWRELIARVRDVYSGLITYNCDKYQEDRVTWWDAVDVISSSGYYPIGSWSAQLDRIEAVVERVGKPFIFMEAGCPSRDTSPELPNDWSRPGAVDLDAQRRWYADVFDACRARSWVGGLMLWDWPAELYELSDAATNDDYCIYGKPAGDLIRREYGEWRREAAN